MRLSHLSRLAMLSIWLLTFQACNNSKANEQIDVDLQFLIDVLDCFVADSTLYNEEKAIAVFNEVIDSVECGILQSDITDGATRVKAHYFGASALSILARCPLASTDIGKEMMDKLVFLTGCWRIDNHERGRTFIKETPYQKREGDERMCAVQIVLQQNKELDSYVLIDDSELCGGADMVFLKVTDKGIDYDNYDSLEAEEQATNKSLCIYRFDSDELYKKVLENEIMVINYYYENGNIESVMVNLYTLHDQLKLIGND